MRKWLALHILLLVPGLAWGGGVLPGEHHEHALAVVGPDSWAVAAGRTVQVWSLSNLEEPVSVLTGPTGPVWSLAASPDGRLLAAGDQDAVVTVWDLETGGVLYRL
ncbi:TPA: WD40 repeat domain-containing protein, partial [Candidatus Bipolaricaulota bacterium]|nr:WD40 repeat domain-containing protein [Candidatus Bipolaricaulota bacterium]